MPDGGRLYIKSRVQHVKVRFLFSDSGVGIPSEVMPKIFFSLNYDEGSG